MPKLKKETTKKKKPRVRGEGVLSRIEPVHLDDSGITMNVYGRSGTGKTTFMASWPKPLLHIICSSGGLGEARSIHNVKGIDVVELLEPDELSQVIEYQTSDKEYKTVCLDHSTGFSDLVLASILNIERVPQQASWGLATQSQYGQLTLQIKEYFRDLLDLKCNVLINSQEREFNVDGESELLAPFVGAAMTPSVTGWLGPACDYVCQTFLRESEEETVVTVGEEEVVTASKTGEVEYCLRVGPHPIYQTKFRLPKGHKLPDVVVDPSYKKIVELIKGG